MMRITPHLAACLLVMAAAAVMTGPGHGADRPNVIVIMTDNHGDWTLGCYGNKDIRTPHIDQLAADGILFDRVYASNPVCSPTRATFFTGLMPSQHGVHCFLRRSPIQIGEGAYDTIGELVTLPKVLKAAGYTMGLVGKWHLGGNMTPQQGFDYWITMPHGGTQSFYDAEVIENGQLRREPVYLTDLWTDHAVRFVEQTQKASKPKPFFLFLSYNGPYGLGGSLMKPARNRHAAYYADKDMPSFTRHEPHPWLHNNKQYINQIEPMRRYGAELSGVDDGVGRLMYALKRMNLEEDTLVMFIADQGWAGGQEGIWGMGDHTRPLHAFDSTMKIPLIIRHTGSIQAGQRSQAYLSNYDMLPTLLGYLGLKDQMPTAPRSPGLDISPVLRGEDHDGHQAVFYEFENTRAIRTRQWKLVLRIPDGPHELYDLVNDPRELTNLQGQEAHRLTEGQLRRQMIRFFEEYAEPRYDLWNGGGSKTRQILDTSIPPIRP